MVPWAGPILHTQLVNRKRVCRCHLYSLQSSMVSTPGLVMRCSESAMHAVDECSSNTSAMTRQWSSTIACVCDPYSRCLRSQLQQHQSPQLSLATAAYCWRSAAASLSLFYSHYPPPFHCCSPAAQKCHTTPGTYPNYRDSFEFYTATFVFCTVCEQTCASVSHRPPKRHKQVTNLNTSWCVVVING